MAAIRAPERASKQKPEEDLSDEQIDALLARATARLKAKKSESQDVLKLSNDEESYKFPRLQTGEIAKPYLTTNKQHVATADAARLVDDKQRKKADGIRRVEEPVKSKKLAREQAKATAGADWYNMPKTNLTPELKRDLQLLKMRNVLDPHRHYKKDNAGGVGGKMKAPEYSQVGTIVGGAQDWFNRVENKQRKRTFVEEVLAGELETKRFKRKAAEVQERKMRGKKGFYKKLQEKRRGGVKKGG